MYPILQVHLSTRSFHGMHCTMIILQYHKMIPNNHLINLKVAPFLISSCVLRLQYLPVFFFMCPAHKRWRSCFSLYIRLSHNAIFLQSHSASTLRSNRSKPKQNLKIKRHYEGLQCQTFAGSGASITDCFYCFGFCRIFLGIYAPQTPSCQTRKGLLKLRVAYLAFVDLFSVSVLAC